MTTRAAVKQRRYRERAMSGRMVAPVEIGVDDVEALVEIGVLDVGDTDNRSAVACAVERLLLMLRVAADR